MKTAVWDVKAQFEKYQGTDVFDCMIAEFLLSDGRYVPSVEVVLESYGVDSLDEVAIKQQESLSKFPKLEKLYFEIEMPLVRVLFQMEKCGIKLDGKRLKEVGQEIENETKRVEGIIKKEVGFEINLNSAMQVGNFLAEKANVPLSKTKTGRYATGESELLKFAGNYPIIDQILEYRMLSKLSSTYVVSLIDKLDESGRIHTTYNQVAVNTGRLSSSNPNLQNIPVTSVFGQKIKSCFVAEKGNTFVSFDYSQQELRILAHLTGEEKLISAFNEGRDVHTTTASQLFSVLYEDVVKDQRVIAKTVNFGIIYGISSFGLSQGLQIPVDEAQTFIDTFYTTYPRIRSYYDQYLKKGAIDGFVETILGRRRYVFEYPKQKFIDNGMKRVLMNYPIQGSAADLMKMAMIQVQKEVLDKDSSVKLLLQIHDDLVFEIPDDKVFIDDFVTKVREIMCTVYPLSVPVEVDVKVGKRWGEMEKIEA